jgi:HSP20 family protein
MKMFENLTGLEGGLFSDLRRMQQDLEEIFGGRTSPTGIRSVARGSYPPINVGVTSEGVDVYLFAAGLDPKTLDISLQQNLLTIAGERTVDMPDSAQYYRRERFSGPFRRTISLPEDVDPDRVEARYVDGILHVAIQRRETSWPRQIEVK